MAKIAKGLPTQIAAGVGRVIVRWAYQEMLLRLIATNAANVNIKTGRIALRDPKNEEFGVFLSDILFVEGLAPQTSSRHLAATLAKAKQRRDLIAHSVWVRDEKSNQLGVQELRGTWDQGQYPNAPRITKKMRPAFRVIDLHYLRETKSMIDETINISNKLNDEILRLRKVLREALLQRAVQANLQSQTQAKPKRQHRSSRG
jgi:hypothetical protein